MTAPEPTPTAEHTDAVARAINAGGWCGTADAVRILTSTDPAVHEALAANLPAEVMLDALVRAGVLTERFAIRDEGGSVWLDAHGDHREAKPGGMEFADRSDAEGIVARPHEEVMRRLVTRWEVAP